MTGKATTCISCGLAAGMLVLTGCGSTRVIDSWRDGSYAGRPARMLVMGVTEVPGPRTLLENEFMRRLQEKDVTTFGGTAFFPGEVLPSEEDVVAKADELQVDAVLVVRYLKKAEGASHAPVRHYTAPVGFATSWEAYRGHVPIPASGGRVMAYDFAYAVLETTLFDRATQQSVWSVLTETRYQEHPLKQIVPFTKTIMRNLDRAGLLPER